MVKSIHFYFRSKPIVPTELNLVNLVLLFLYIFLWISSMLCGKELVFIVMYVNVVIYTCCTPWRLDAKFHGGRLQWYPIDRIHPGPISTDCHSSPKQTIIHQKLCIMNRVNCFLFFIEITFGNVQKMIGVLPYICTI